MKKIRAIGSMKEKKYEEEERKKGKKKKASSEKMGIVLKVGPGWVGPTGLGWVLTKNNEIFLDPWSRNCKSFKKKKKEKECPETFNSSKLYQTRNPVINLNQINIKDETFAEIHGYGIPKNSPKMRAKHPKTISFLEILYTLN